MKIPSTLLMTMCGSLLAGCATPTASMRDDPLSSTLQAFIDTAQSLYKRGRELHRESRLAEAGQYYQHALRLDPSHMESQNAMAALDASQGDVDRAINLLTSLAEQHPDAAHIHANLGYAYFLKGQVALARESLERATMLDPTNENSWSKLNMVNAEISRRETLAHYVEAGKQLAQSEETTEIKSVMPGVYALRYPNESMPVMAEVREPEIEQRPLALVSVAALPPLGRVELVNGNGVTGLARALRGLIAVKQWQVVRTRNNDQYSVKATRIEYASSYYPAARQLADAIGIDAVLRLNDHQEGSNLRVVLGHDFKSVEPLRQRLAGTPAPAGY